MSNFIIYKLNFFLWSCSVENEKDEDSLGSLPEMND